MKATKVLKFEAEWCGPCKNFSKVWTKVAPEFQEVTFEVVDIDKKPDLAAYFGIRSIPAVVAMSDISEAPLAIKVGAMSEVAFRQWLLDLQQK